MTILISHTDSLREFVQMLHSHIMQLKASSQVYVRTSACSGWPDGHAQCQEYFFTNCAQHRFLQLHGCIGLFPVGKFGQAVWVGVCSLVE